MSVTALSKGEIGRLRAAHRFGGGDLYAATSLGLIVERSEILPRLEEECRKIGELLDKVPEFTERCGYDWARSTESYDVPTDAAFQRRVLSMLVKFWIEAPKRDQLAERIAGVVAIQEYVTRFGLCSPRIRSVRGAKLLAVPAGFIEFSLWFYAGLRAWIAAAATPVETDHDASWDVVTASLPTRQPTPFRHVCVLELVARTLAEAGRDRVVEADNAALLIREQIPSLQGPTGELDPEGLKHFEQNASYMIVEFALAHEIGHLLCASPIGTVGSFDGAAERRADELGCLLLAMTAQLRVFGWGDEILLPDTQAALGVSLFTSFLDARIALAGRLGRGTAAPRLGQERARAAIAREHFSALLSDLRGRGSLEDARRIADLDANCAAYLDDIRATIDDIADAEIEAALSIAKATVTKGVPVLPSDRKHVSGEDAGLGC